MKLTLNYKIMESKVLKAIMERYGSLTTLYSVMRECTDTVLVNLTSDVNDEFDEEEILAMITKTRLLTIEECKSLDLNY
jgi:hypothetical protein